MKRIIYSFSMMAALFCFASCSEKMNLEQPDVTNKITVTTQVDPHTKAGYETSETVTVLPEKFYIEIDQDGNDKDYRLPLTREPNTNNYQASIELQWKGTDHTNTKVKAMTIPYGLTSVDMENPMAIAINKEQSNPENLKASDLLGASTTIGGIAIQDNNINIAFKHLMSKLQITYTKPDDIQINSVQLKNTCVKGGYSYASMAYDSSIAAEFGDITMYHEAVKKSAEAIFFPYTPTSDPKLVVNATINGQTKAFECPIVLKQSSAFVGGKRYIMTVTVSETGIEGVVTMIKDWNPNSSQVAGERVLWIGTSIPAGSPSTGIHSYPELVDQAMNCTVVNNAVAGSLVITKGNYSWTAGGWDPNNTYYSLTAGGLSQTKDEAYNTYYPFFSSLTDDANLIQQELNKIYNLSYEELIIPYINGVKDNCTTVIIDHGFNDRVAMIFEALGLGPANGYVEGYDYLMQLKNKKITYDEYLSLLELDPNLTQQGNYIVGMSKVIQAIRNVNPNIRIIIGNYFTLNCPYITREYEWTATDPALMSTTYMNYSNLICHFNEAVAGMWDLDIVNVYEHLYIPSDLYWGGWNYSDNTVIYDAEKFCPDGVHPFNPVALNAIADVWISALNGVVGSVN